MVESGASVEAHQGLGKNPTRLGGKVPLPEDMYNVPANLLACVVEIAPKMKKTGAWWALGGDLSENMSGVFVRPRGVEILTNAAGVEKISSALSSYKLSPIEVRETRLDRDAELDLKKYPILVRSRYTEFTLNGTKVAVDGDYQMKVGEWDWGDPLFFDPDFVNIAGLRVPVMPTSLKTDLYITLGWNDRARLISEAFTRAHSPTYEGPIDSNA
jgi:hypothetical protein